MLQQDKRIYRILSVIAAAVLFATCLGLPWQGAAADEPETETVESYPYTTVTRVKVNLRAGRSTRSALLRKIPEGAEITVLSEEDLAEIDRSRIGLKGSPTRVKRTFVPQKRKSGQMINEGSAAASARKLAELLSGAGAL